MTINKQKKEFLIDEIKRKVELLLQTDSISEEEKILIVERAFSKIKDSRLKEVQNDRSC